MELVPTNIAGDPVGTLTLPLPPIKGHLQAIVCYYLNCQPSGP